MYQTFRIASTEELKQSLPAEKSNVTVRKDSKAKCVKKQFVIKLVLAAVAK